MYNKFHLKYLNQSFAVFYPFIVFEDCRQPDIL